MASVYSIAFLATFLVLQPMTSTSNVLSPIIDDVCNKVECGRGTCKSSPNSTLLFECVCEPGWKQTRPDHDDGLKFLPCVIPNCTLDYTCTEAAPPVQDKEGRANESIFDPCFWIDCGGGTCKKTSLFTHGCECTEGYNNLLNITAFPCFRECMLGVDCSSLGITSMNKSSTTTTGVANKGNSQASFMSRGNINWLIVVAISLVPILWR